MSQNFIITQAMHKAATAASRALKVAALGTWTASPRCALPPSATAAVARPSGSVPRPPACAWPVPAHALAVPVAMSPHRPRSMINFLQHTDLVPHMALRAQA